MSPLSGPRGIRSCARASAAAATRTRDGRSTRRESSRAAARGGGSGGLAAASARGRVRVQPHAATMDAAAVDGPTRSRAEERARGRRARRGHDDRTARARPGRALGGARGGGGEGGEGGRRVSVGWLAAITGQRRDYAGAHGQSARRARRRLGRAGPTPSRCRRSWRRHRGQLAGDRDLDRHRNLWRASGSSDRLMESGGGMGGGVGLPTPRTSRFKFAASLKLGSDGAPRGSSKKRFASPVSRAATMACAPATGCAAARPRPKTMMMRSTPAPTRRTTPSRVHRAVDGSPDAWERDARA